MVIIKWHHFGTKTYRYLFLSVLIVVLIKVKVNRLSISGRSLHAKWRHWHLNSRDSVFQNGDHFNGREDTYLAFKSWFFFPHFFLPSKSKEVSFYNHTISCIQLHVTEMLSIGSVFYSKLVNCIFCKDVEQHSHVLCKS